MNKMKIHLHPSFFSEKEKVLFESGDLRASVFIFDNGVLGLRMSNKTGELIMLPYQGMQIWSASFNGRNLTMKSMFTQPKPTQQYLETYGGFLIHCGLSSMGVPTKEDHHPLHGELPNAPFDSAYLLTGEDVKGHFLALGGSFQNTVAFSDNYVSEPVVKLYENSSIFNVSLSVTNLKKTPMEYMYLAHINYRPVDGGKLIYSALVSPQTVRVRSSIPSHVHPGPGFREFLEELARNPEKHQNITPDMKFDPEVVFFIDYLIDEDGWAHTMQLHPDGSSDYVRHQPAQLDKGIRWICRTPDQDAMGMILPATAEPEGYTAEKAKGNVKILQPGKKFFCEMEMGVLNDEETKLVTKVIQQIISKT